MHQSYHIPRVVRLSASKLHKNACATILSFVLLLTQTTPTINKPAIVTALGWQLLVKTQKKTSLPEMGAL